MGSRDSNQKTLTLWQGERSSDTPSHPLSQQLQTYTAHTTCLTHFFFSHYSFKCAHLFIIILRSGRPSHALYSPLKLALMMALVVVAGKWFQTNNIMIAFFIFSLSIHPRRAISLYFQLFYQIIGKTAAMANTHEYNNKCFSNGKQKHASQILIESV